MGLTVYGNHISQPSRSVFLFCKVTGIPYTEKILDFVKGELREEAYLKINPIGQVPSIVDDDFTLTECFSIIKYLAAKNKVADHWYPAELKARAKVNEYLDWHHTGLRKGGMDICKEQVLNPLLHGTPTDEEKLVKDYENFGNILGVVEKAFLGDGAFLCGGEISIADICAVSEITQIVWFQPSGSDVLAKHPKLAAWKDRVAKRLNPAYDEVHQNLINFAAFLASKK